MKRRKNYLIKIGDLVFPREDNEVLFIDSEKISSEEDLSEMVWDNSPGIVIDIAMCHSILDCFQIFVVVDNIVGWTYSDYVKVIQRR